jgi:hypothetical protein
MSIYKKKLLDNLDKPAIAYIPNQLERVGKYYRTVPARYTLIGSVSGVGKTSFVDDALILKPYSWLKTTSSDIYFETLYFSMERKMDFKMAKFASWKLYHDKKIRLSSDIILGYEPDKPLRPEHKVLIKSFQPWMDGLFDVVKIKDGARSVADIALEIELLAKRLGTLFTTDSTFLYVNGRKQNHVFKTIDTPRGKIKVVTFKYKEHTYELEQNEHLYVPNNPKSIINIVIDHIGKTLEDGYNSKKQTIDALDAVLSRARDLYGFNPIVISQFNRSLSDITRIKYSKGNLEPMYEDFKDSGNTVESADLVLSLFNPYKYGSYDDDGEYKGYNIKEGLLTPGGSQRFRSLHILKNSFGIDNVTFGLSFVGESMYFSTLPLPSDTKALNKIYESIARGN